MGIVATKCALNGGAVEGYCPVPSDSHYPATIQFYCPDYPATFQFFSGDFWGVEFSSYSIPAFKLLSECGSSIGSNFYSLISLTSFGLSIGSLASFVRVGPVGLSDLFVVVSGAVGSVAASEFFDKSCCVCAGP